MPERERHEYLRQIELFADLSDAKRAAIADRCTWRDFEPGGMICSQGDPAGGVYFLADGTVRASIYSADGKHVVFQDMHSGCMFGEISAIDGSERSASIETMTPCLVASLSPDAFADVLRQEPELGLKVIRMLAGSVRRLSLRVVEFSTLTVPHRVHAELLRLAGGARPGQPEGRISPIPTLSEIADKISTHREAVSRELSRLTRRGLLVRTADSLLISDMAKLEELVDAADLA